MDRRVEEGKKREEWSETWEEDRNENMKEGKRKRHKKDAERKK